MTDDLFADRPDREGYEQPAHVAAIGMTNLGFAVLRSIGGDEAVTQRPLVPTLTAEIMQPAAADPAQGVAVAVRLRQQAHLLIEWWVGDARGTGLSWADLAAPLGVQPGPDDDAATPLALLTWARYRELADTENARNGRAYWGCQTCRKAVVEYGPLNDNPQENEYGHAAECARHQREISAWSAAQSLAGQAPTDPATH